MSGKFFGMRLFQSLNGLIVRLKLSELLLVLLDAAVEASLELLDLAAEVGNFALVVGLEGLLLRQQSLLVL